MNVLVIDSQGILSVSNRENVQERLTYSLARFHHRIQGVTAHLAIDEDCEKASCSINVNLKGFGVLSVAKSGESADEVLNLAIQAIENKVAFRVDWKGWINADKLATRFAALGQRFAKTLGLESDNQTYPQKRALGYTCLNFQDQHVQFRETNRTCSTKPHFGISRNRLNQFSN